MTPVHPGAGAGADGATARPIFVGGCPRSGTTLLGALLGTHPDHVCVPEMPFKLGLLRRAGAGVGSRRAAELLRGTLCHWSFRLWELDPGRVSPPEEGSASGRELVEAVVRAYAGTVDRERASVWIDHTPANVWYAETLRQAFPDGRLVHVVRDGRAVAASIVPLDWGPNTVSAAAGWWARNLAAGFAAESHWGAERAVRVRYEELVGEPEPTLRRLCSFLGLDFRPGMLAGTGFRVPRYTAAQHVLVGRPADAARGEAWRGALTARQIEVFESLTRELLPMLGYAPVYGPRAAGPRRLERARWGLEESAWLAVNQVRFRVRRALRVPHAKR